MAKFESQKVIQHLQAKWGSKACPMCSSGPWNVQDTSFQLTEFNEGNMVIGGPVIPLVTVMCGNCGYVVLVNAIVAGVLKAQPESKKKEAKP